MHMPYKGIRLGYQIFRGIMTCRKMGYCCEIIFFNLHLLLLLIRCSHLSAAYPVSPAKCICLSQGAQHVTKNHLTIPHKAE